MKRGLTTAAVFVGIISGFIGGYMAGKNGLPDPWHQLAAVAYVSGMFVALGLAGAATRPH